jgi:hypothetical protein
MQMKLELKREIDTLLVFAITVAGLKLAGLPIDPATFTRFLGMTSFLFLGALASLGWVAAAIVTDWLWTTTPRSWTGIAAFLLYMENASPYFGLIACFLSIIRALREYSTAGATATAQAELTGEIGTALGATVAGCIIALVAYSFRSIVVHRGTVSS